MIRRLILLLGCLSVLLASAAPPARVVRVGVYDNPPKIHLDHEGRADGILVDLLEEVAHAEGWTLRFVPCEWSRCLAALAAGEIELLPDVASTEERARTMDFHRVPALLAWSQAYRRPGVALFSIADLGGKRVAVLSGSIQERYLADLAKDPRAAPRIVAVPSIAEGFRLVERGEADAVVANMYAGALLARRHGIIETPVIFQPAPLFYAAAKGRNPELLAAVDRRLGAWQTDPESVYFDILGHWRSQGLLAQVPSWVWWSVASLLVLALLQAAWLRRQVARKTAALKKSEQRLATILDSVDSLIYIKDASRRYTYANRALRAFLGRGHRDIIGCRDSDLFPEAAAAQIGRSDARTMLERRRVVTEETVPGPQGKDVTVLSTKIPLSDDDGRPYGLCGISIDISERRAAEESNRVAATVFQSAEGMFIAGPDRRILRVNAAYCAMSRRTEEQLAGAPLPPFSVSRDGADASEEMWQALAASGKWQGEVWTRRGDGLPYPARLTLTTVRDGEGRITHYVGTQGDISVQTQAQEEVAKLAYFDPLTGLPNRRLLLERLRHCTPLHERAGAMFALLFLDLDNFKDLNDLHGHEAGDRLLQQVGKRVSACLRAGDTVARLGGDEFVVLLENVGTDQAGASHHVATAGWKIIEAIRQPFDLGGQTHHASASLGAVLGTGATAGIEDLMKRGDMAMYAAKRAGRNTLRFFHPDMEMDVTSRLALEAELRAALAGAQFTLHYQPQVGDDGRIRGAEALLRWTSPSRGPVSPAEFIPVAEASNLILPLGDWVLHSACRQLARWRHMPGMGGLTLAVNVSVRQFRQPGFGADVLRIVGEYGIDPSRLKLELTESMLIDDFDDTIERMHELKRAGIGFALDDFGTGYSSLSYLKRLPLDQLKIYRAFVRDILGNQNDASIARSIVALGQALGLGIIAEGVETPEQRQFLAEIGCSCCQGYLFGQPMDAADFEQLVAGQAG